MPAAEWGDRELDDLVPPVGNEIEFRRFRLLDEREVEMKGLGDMAVREIHNTGMGRPTQSAEDRASASLEFSARARQVLAKGLGSEARSPQVTEPLRGSLRALHDRA